MKVLKFGAIWCTECLVMKPMWAAIEAEIPELETEYYDADEAKDIVNRYKVEDIPAFIFLDQNGKEFLRLKGIQNKDDLLKIVKDNLEK